MSDFVRDLLIARRAIGNAGFVFPAPGKAGHIVDPVSRSKPLLTHRALKSARTI